MIFGRTTQKNLTSASFSIQTGPESAGNLLLSGLWGSLDLLPVLTKHTLLLSQPRYWKTSKTHRFTKMIDYKRRYSLDSQMGQDLVGSLEMTDLYRSKQILINTQRLYFYSASGDQLTRCDIRSIS